MGSTTSPGPFSNCVLIVDSDCGSAVSDMVFSCSPMGPFKCVFTEVGREIRGLGLSQADDQVKPALHYSCLLPCLFGY